MASRVFDLIGQEELRQATTVELIASENFVSSDVLRAVGSCLTNKYSEGYPAHRAMGNQGRYYGGCHIVDELRSTASPSGRRSFPPTTTSTSSPTAARRPIWRPTWLCCSPATPCCP